MAVLRTHTCCSADATHCNAWSSKTAEQTRASEAGFSQHTRVKLKDGGSICHPASMFPVSQSQIAAGQRLGALSASAYRKHSTKVGKLRTLKQQQPQSHFSVHHGWKTDLKCAVGLGCAAVTSGWALPVGRRIDLHLAPGGFYRASRLGVLLEQPSFWVGKPGLDALYKPPKPL